MTENTHQSSEQGDLAFDWRDFTKVRVRPAQFAKMCAVSRQTVSCWIRDGKVTLGADGRLDPAVAARQVMERSDPSRLRARVFKTATEDAASLRQRIAALEAQLEGARDRIAYLQEFSAASERHHEFFIELLKARRHILTDSENFAVRLQLLDETAIYCADGYDPDDSQDEGGHDPRVLLDRQLALFVPDSLRAVDENEGGRG